jgi:hypothetical protein
LSNQTIVSDNPGWDQGWLAKLLAMVNHSRLPVISLDRVLSEQMQRLMLLNIYVQGTPEWHREMRRLLDHGHTIIGNAQFNAIVAPRVQHRALDDAQRLWHWWHSVKDQIDAVSCE